MINDNLIDLVVKRVAAYTSPPYADYAKLILKVSHNLGANLGICLLAVHAGGRNGSLVDVATHTPARGRVFAKTGTLIAGDPLSDRLLVQTKALAGYYQAANGAWRVFDVVVNNAGAGQNVQPVLDANEDLGQIAAALWRHAN